ncbi:hypothetical protein BX600DRAFT_496554 [Xylariales sp. PMI_506]|nr:hypothetical protein BX600DRAFT_496554 [Xylariales sp. PMI_506]
MSLPVEVDDDISLGRNTRGGTEARIKLLLHLYIKMLLSDLVGEPEPQNVPSIWETFKDNVYRRPQSLAISCLHQTADLYGLESQRPSSDRPDCYSHKPWLRWTYRTLFEGILRLTGGISVRELQQGAPLFTFLGNGVESFLCQWAAHASGYCFVPLHPNSLANRAEVTHMVQTVLDYTGDTPHRNCRRRSISRADRFIIAAIPCLQDNYGTRRFRRLDLFRQAAPVADQELQVGSGTEKVIYFTSGSTALPKGCVWEYPRGTLCVQRLLQSSDNIHQNSRIFVPLPNNHVAAYVCVLPWIMQGGAVVFHDQGFDPEAMIRGLYLEQCTSTLIVPTMAHVLAATKAALDLCLPNLTVMLAGSPCTSLHIQECLQGLGAIAVSNCWGMTECIQTTTTFFSDAAQFTKGSDISVGQVPLGARVKICVPGKTLPVPINTPGEFHVSSKTIIPDYIGLKGECKDFYFDEDGVRWFKTGDQALVDPRGLIFIMGRHKEVIIRGGENISPIAIEMAIAEEPRLKRRSIHIFGAPDPIAGQIPVAVTAEKPDHDTFDLIRQTIQTRMGLIYVPSKLIELKDLGLQDWPKTLIGKLQRNKVAARVEKYVNAQNRENREDDHTSKVQNLSDKIKNIWATTLGVHTDHLPMDRPFKTFTDSVTLMRVRASISKKTGRAMSLAEMSHAKTIATYIDLLQGIPAHDSHKSASRAQQNNCVKAMKHNNNLASEQKSKINSTLASVGFEWRDVVDIMPVSDLYEIMSRREDFNGWAASLVLEVQNIAPARLEECLRPIFRVHPLLVSCCVRTAPEEAFHVVLQQTPFTLARIVRHSGSVKTIKELAAIPRTYSAPRGPSALPGPLTYAEIFKVESTGATGLVLTVNHMVMDASYVEMILDDLNTAIEGREPETHVSYKTWNDTYQRSRGSVEALAAVDWHVNQLRGLHLHRDAIWPDSQAGLGHQCSYQHTFHCSDLNLLRQTHSDIAPSTIFKVAHALEMAKRTRTSHVVFVNCEGERATMPFTPADRPRGIEHEATDVAGPTYSLVFNIVEIKPEDTIISFLYRHQACQHNLSKHATAPWHDILAALGPDAKHVERLAFASCFNWLPSMNQPARGVYANVKLLDTYFSSVGGLEVDCALGGLAQDKAVVYVSGTGINLRGMKEFTLGMESSLRFMSASENWEKPIKDIRGLF